MKSFFRKWPRKRRLEEKGRAWYPQTFEVILEGTDLRQAAKLLVEQIMQRKKEIGCHAAFLHPGMEGGFNAETGLSVYRKRVIFYRKLTPEVERIINGGKA